MRPSRALLVGVSRYDAVSGLPEQVRNDVMDLAVLLADPARGGIDPVDITLLLDEEVTLQSLRDAFRDAVDRMPDDGTFLFYFSGHGERGLAMGREQSWLLPHDADLDNLLGTAMSSDELVQRLDALGAVRQVVIVDACHAGGMGKLPGARVPKGFGVSGIEALRTGTGRILLTSCRSDELSGIMTAERNSVFTRALLEALQGAGVDRGDGLVRVLDVFTYVSDVVPKRYDQHPVFHAGDVDGNFPIALRPKALAKATAGVSDAVALFASLYPAGPAQDALWSRAGGDLSRLTLSGSGMAQWHSAVSRIALGGGGLEFRELVTAALGDYPGNVGLKALSEANLSA